MWIVYALLSALTKGFGNYLNKIAADRVDPYILMFLNRLFWLIFWIPLILIFDDTGSYFSLKILWLFLASSLINIVVIITTYKAVKDEDVSRLTPITSLSPAWGLVFGLLFIGELPEPVAIGGVFLTIFGAYLLNVSAAHDTWRHTLAEMRAHKSTVRMLGVAMGIGLVVTIDKIALEDVSIYLWGFGIVAAQVVFTAPFAARSRSTLWPTFVEHKKVIVSMAFVSVIAFWFHLLAFAAGGLVALVLAIKRLDSLVTVILGHKLLEEEHIKQRLTGAATMASGAIIIGISQL